MAIPKPVERILLLQAGGIGDLVMSVPTLRALRAAYPGADIGLYAISRAADLIAQTHYVNWVFTGPFFETTGKSLKELLANAAASIGTFWKLRCYRPDIVIDLNSVESRAAAMKRAALLLPLTKRRIGRNTNGRGFYLTDKTEEDLYGDVHEVYRIAGTLEHLGVSVPDPHLEIALTEDHRTEANAYLQNLGLSDGSVPWGVNPCAFRPTRNWGKENFAEIVKHLQKKYGGPILVFGGPGDEALVHQVISSTDAQPVLGLSLGALCAALSRCKLLVTNDTGPMHLAAAVHIPILAIFGPENANRYGPFLPQARRRIVQHPVSCAPCKLYECVKEEHRCMRSLERDRVLAKVDGFIQTLSGRDSNAAP